METNGVAPEWGCNPFWSDSIHFNESCVASVMAAMTLLDADAWCKWALTPAMTMSGQVKMSSGQVKFCGTRLV